jgi:hypothetical protein
MSSRLRSLGLRIAFLFSVVAAVLAVRVTVAKPSFPFVLLDSFDKALSLVSDAAEKRIADLERRRTAPDATATTVSALLERLDGEVTVACDAATDMLDTELVLVDMLPELRRASVRGCIERLLVKTRHDRANAIDAAERAEYDATLERLREIRRLV